MIRSLPLPVLTQSNLNTIVHFDFETSDSATAFWKEQSAGPGAGSALVDDFAVDAGLYPQLSHAQHAGSGRAHSDARPAHLRKTVFLDRGGISDRPFIPTSGRICDGRAGTANWPGHLRYCLVSDEHGPWSGAQLANPGRPARAARLE